MTPINVNAAVVRGAKSVNFKRRADRTDSLEALMALHNTGSIINWSAEPYLHPYPLLSKWEERINRFENIRDECEKYIGKSNFDDILFYATNALRIVRKTWGVGGKRNPSSRRRCSS